MRVFRRCKICGCTEKDRLVICDACHRWVCDECVSYWYEDANNCLKCYGEIGMDTYGEQDAISLGLEEDDEND